MSETRRRRARRRAEGQRLRIIRLLEEIAEVDAQEQCEGCGDWFSQLSAHEPHCKHVTSPTDTDEA
jgi:hypothetical protein